MVGILLQTGVVVTRLGLKRVSLRNAARARDRPPAAAAVGLGSLLRREELVAIA